MPRLAAALLAALLPAASSLSLPGKAPSTCVDAKSATEFRQLLADGVQYHPKHVKVVGDSSALNTAEGAARAHHPVAEVLHRRRAAGTAPGEHGDGCRVALSIEGGGMRGCVAAGMVAAIQHLGLTDGLDAVYGSSAGSLVGAYLLARQVPRYGCSIYYETLPNAGERFIDLKNIMRSLGLGWMRLTPTGVRDMLKRTLGMPVLNLDYLLDDIVQQRKPLDWDALWRVQEKQPLRVDASDLHAEDAVRHHAHGVEKR